MLKCTPKNADALEKTPCHYKYVNGIDMFSRNCPVSRWGVGGAPISMARAAEKAALACVARCENFGRLVPWLSCVAHVKNTGGGRRACETSPSDEVDSSAVDQSVGEAESPFSGQRRRQWRPGLATRIFCAEFFAQTKFLRRLEIHRKSSYNMSPARRQTR